jgi:hypothetical protein
LFPDKFIAPSQCSLPFLLSIISNVSRALQILIDSFDSNTMMKLTFSLCLACFCIFSNAQHFKYKAQLPFIDTSSFYKIQIPPVIAGKSQPALDDVRIVDKKNKENPYVVKTSSAVFTEKDFEELKIISKSKGADNQTHIVIENANKKRLHDLLLFIKNTQVQQAVIVSGGEDTATWYIIKEDLLFERFANNNSSASFVQSISLPSVDYRYLKITIAGKGVLPVNITRAGISSEKSFSGKFVQLPTPIITTIDSSNKRSYIHLKFDETYQVDKLELEIGAPKFYNRQLDIYSDRKLTFPPHQFTAASNIPASFPLQIKAKELLLVIENNDNPPLQVTAVKAWQLDKYLLTYLSKGESYTLLFSDSTALAPAYDLRFFMDSIPAILPVIVPAKAETIAAVFVKKQEEPGKPVFLWIVIFAVLCLLLFACYKLVRQLDREKKN